MGDNPSKLGNFARGKIIGFYLIRVFLLLCNWSEVHYLCYCLTEKDLKWQTVADQTRLERKLNGWSKRYFTVTSRVLKSISELNFIVSTIWSICHFSFHVSKNSCITSYENHREVRWQMLKTVWQKCIWDRKNYHEISKLLFQCGVMQLFFFDGIFLSTVAFEKFLRSKPSEGQPL